MQDLSITLIQSELHWHQIEANLAMFEEKIWEIKGPTDLILLPEMFSTGFTMDLSLAEPMNSKTFRWMKQMATQTKALVLGSYIVQENGKCFNRLLWMEPDGVFQYYDKRHLFSMADEDQHFSPGNSRLVGAWKGWNICPLICYDLRFPVWSRNRMTNDQLAYDLLVFPANWPQARVQAWDSLLKARAIENACYCAGLNRTGSDGNDIQYNGQSAVYDFKGNPLFLADHQPCLQTLTLDHQALMDYRERFPVQLDADAFELK